jgi:hypothetical protein
MIGEQRIGQHLDGSDHGLTQIISWHLPQETEKNHEKLPIRIARVPAEIRIEHLTNFKEQRPS